jgi:hypothetical protein
LVVPIEQCPFMWRIRGGPESVMCACLAQEKIVSHDIRVHPKYDLRSRLCDADTFEIQRAAEEMGDKAEHARLLLNRVRQSAEEVKP